MGGFDHQTGGRELEVEVIQSPRNSLLAALRGTKRVVGSFVFVRRDRCWVFFLSQRQAGRQAVAEGGESRESRREEGKRRDCRLLGIARFKGEERYKRKKGILFSREIRMLEISKYIGVCTL